MGFFDFCKFAEPRPGRPGAVAAGLLLLVRIGLPIVVPGSSIYGLLGAVLFGLLVLVWWAFLSRVPHFDRWGAVVLMIVAVAATPRILHQSIVGGMMGMMFRIYVIPGLCLALVLSLSPALASAQPAAIITTIAGGGPADGSPALSAALFWPMRVAMVPGSSDFYVSVIESHRVYRVSASTGAITTVVGAGGPGYNGDNIPATSAQIAAPYGITVDTSTGDLYIADGGNHRIRKVTAATGLISTVAGGYYGGYFNGDNGPATAATLHTPMSVAFDQGNGDVLIADTYSNRVRRVSATTGIITTVAGTSTPGFNGDGILATAAQLYQPLGVTVS